MYKQYRRTQTTWLRPVTIEDIKNIDIRVSISLADKEKGSPKIGDMIARNKDDHGDMWLVEEQYFKDNFEEI